MLCVPHDRKSSTLRSAAGLALGALALGALVACGSDDAGNGGGSTATGGTGGTATDAGSCERSLGPADGPRKVVVAHPYDASQAKSDAFEVLSLDASGVLSKTGVTFQLGRAVDGEIVFTPDGELGFVATEDGKVGVFRFEPSGDVTVLNPGFSGSFYAGKLVMDPKGNRLYVLDSEWRDIGGGVYALAIGCDDSLAEEGLVAPAKLPQGFALLSKTPGRALVAADDILASPQDQHLHLLDWGATPSVVASISAFSGDSPIISSLAVTSDEKYALLGDNSGFSSVPNRVAVVELGGDTLKPLQEVSSIEDPADIETSPFDATALVASGFGDALFVLSHDASQPNAPYSSTELAYSGAKPQLPVTMTMIRRGALEGRVLVSEVSAVRQVAFGKGSAPTDLGPFDMGSGVENVLGALGVQP